MMIMQTVLGMGFDKTKVKGEVNRQCQSMGVKS